jgi:hypothetical protein
MGSTTASSEGPCSRKLEPTDVMLRVLRPLAHHSLKADVFGFAIRPILASVYYEYAARLAVEEEYVEFDARTILGCVIAHELGHLLLGSNSHSSAGIMRSPWGQKQVREALMGTLLFTAEQAELMQAQVRARTRPTRNNPKDEFMQSADPFGQTNEPSASTSKNEGVELVSAAERVARIRHKEQVPGVLMLDKRAKRSEHSAQWHCAHAPSF